MSDLTYFLGIIFALLAGIVVYIGALIQKSVINKHSNDPKFIRNLVRSPIWFMGLLLQIVIGGLVFYFIAIIFIGPALVPGLMSVGLIVLALGSVKILKETLGKEEVIGISVMIAGITLIGFSELSIDVSIFNILDYGFIFRIISFTIIVLSLAIVFEILRRKYTKDKGLIMAIEAGLILSTIGQISLKYGQANILVPLTSVPIQTIPIIAFFVIFLSTPPNILSVFFMIIGFTLVIISSFLLTKRQAKLEKIEK